MIEDKLNQLITVLQQLQANKNQLNENIKGENSVWAKLDHAYDFAKQCINYYTYTIPDEDSKQSALNFANTVDNIRNSYVSSSMISDQFKQSNMNLIQTCNEIYNHTCGHMTIIRNTVASEAELQLSEKLLAVEKAVQNKEISEEKASKLVQKIKNSQNGSTPELESLLNEYSKKLSKDETSVTSEKVELQSKCFDEKNIDIIDTYIKNIENLNAKVEEVNAIYQTKNNDSVLNDIFSVINIIGEELPGKQNEYNGHYVTNNKVIAELNIRLNKFAEIYQEKNQIENNNLDQAINDVTVQANATNGYSKNEMFQLHKNCNSKLLIDIVRQTQEICDLKENVPPEITPFMTRHLQNELNNQNKEFHLIMNNSNVSTAEQNVAIATQIQKISTILQAIEKGVTV